jgi:hypothetical protein
MVKMYPIKLSIAARETPVVVVNKLFANWASYSERVS